MKRGMTKKQLACFGADGKLKIIKQWMYKGDSYSARRDTDGYIEIVEDKNYYSVTSGRLFCFGEDEIDNLARKCGVLE
jgi:hypothetical protein